MKIDEKTKQYRENVVWHDTAIEEPDEGITVLIKMPSPGEPVWLGFLEDGDWHTIEGMACAYEVTHWAELPNGPND